MVYSLSICLDYNNSNSDEWWSELTSQVWTAFRNGTTSWHVNRPRYGLTTLRNTSPRIYQSLSNILQRCSEFIKAFEQELRQDREYINSLKE